MFCTTLRTRPEWKAAIPMLQQIRNPKWTEKSLITHDIAMPLTRPSDQGEYFRLLLVSASDCQALDTVMTRIERLYHLNGSHHIGVVFLLGGEDGKEERMNAFMALQESLLKSAFEMLVLPLHDVSALPETLFLFHRPLLQARIAPNAIHPGATILPYCSASRPLSEHTRNIISDIVPSLRELARAATTADGQAMIREWLGEHSGQSDDIIDFWLQEYVVG